MTIDSGDYGWPPGIDSGSVEERPHPIVMTGPEALRMEMAELRSVVQGLAVEVGHLRETVGRLAAREGTL